MQNGGRENSAAEIFVGTYAVEHIIS